MHVCLNCKDTGVVDSGGQNPDGSWIELPCPYCSGGHEFSEEE